jgi:hypothetical protein
MRCVIVAAVTHLDLFGFVYFAGHTLRPVRAFEPLRRISERSGSALRINADDIPSSDSVFDHLQESGLESVSEHEGKKQSEHGL